MCIEAMMTERKNQRGDGSYQLKWSKSKKRKLAYTSVVKAAVQKYNDLCVKKRMINRKTLRKSARRLGLFRSALWEKRRDAGGFPLGAMAPHNTTQYLMDMAYRDMNVTDQSFDLDLSPSDFCRQSNVRTDERFTSSMYSSLYTDEETMDFQHRDFESVFFLHEI